MHDNRIITIIPISFRFTHNRITGENHRPAANHWQTLSHNALSCASRHERDANIKL